MITVSNPKIKDTFAPETFPEVSENVISFLFEPIFIQNPRKRITFDEGKIRTS